MLVNTEPVVWRETTERFFENADNFNLNISPLVAAEIERAPAEYRTIVKERIDNVKPGYLREKPEIRELATEYIEREIITEKYFNDAFHIAYASYYAMDILASFNFRHIVRYRNKEMVHAANILLGYNTPKIVSPEELI